MTPPVAAIMFVLNKKCISFLIIRLTMIMDSGLRQEHARMSMHAFILVKKEQL